MDSATFYQHPEQAEERRVVLHLRFTHAVARDELEKHVTLSALQDGGEEALAYHIEYDAPRSRRVPAFRASAYPGTLLLRDARDSQGRLASTRRWRNR